MVIGIQGGLSATLLGHETDLSFRQCLGVTPIIVKQEYVFKKNIIDSSGNSKHYDHKIYAFQVDYSNDAMHAFELMVDHFTNGDTVHLIWVKPDEQASNFGNDNVQAINMIFKPYQNIIKHRNLVKWIFTSTFIVICNVSNVFVCIFI